METAQQPAGAPIESEPESVVLEMEAGEPAATVRKYSNVRRNWAFDAALVVAPIATGVLASMGGTRRIGRGILAGAGAALALGALRLQMARWFTAMPDYELVATAGPLELREYPACVEARAVVDAPDIETALDRGFDRLACFLWGANSKKESLDMTAPVLAEMSDGRYVVTFIMPPDRTLVSLPLPDDARVELRERNPRHVAVLKFHGRFTGQNIHSHERELLGYVVDAGLVGRGSVAFAGYDAPVTLPFLRRNELWLEVT